MAVERGWIKLHIAVDVDTKKTVSHEVTDESVGDPGGSSLLSTMYLKGEG